MFCATCRRQLFSVLLTGPVIETANGQWDVRPAVADHKSAPWFLLRSSVWSPGKPDGKIWQGTDIFPAVPDGMLFVMVLPVAMFAAVSGFEHGTQTLFMIPWCGIVIRDSHLPEFLEVVGSLTGKFSHRSWSFNTQDNSWSRHDRHIGGGLLLADILKYVCVKIILMANVKHG